MPVISKKKKEEENTGSVEFQVFNFTNKIQRLTLHFELDPQDYSSQRGLRIILGKRQRLVSIMSKDTIADILTLIRNADRNGKRIVKLPRTEIIKIIVEILVRQGLVEYIRKDIKRKDDFYFLFVRYKRKKKRESHIFIFKKESARAVREKIKV